ncbi:MAG: amidohydrolase [Bryobacteraceae bacterium]|nr:amidohydrolase [Bryobacteraceae bacterium]
MRSTRRQLLQGVAAGSLAAQGSKAGRIDCQSHLFSEEFLRLLEKRKTSPYVYRKEGESYIVVGDWHRKLMPKHTSVEAKLADMDKAGIAMAALSINDPGPELFGSDAPAMAVLLNDFIAEAVRKNPARFFGMATLPFNTPAAMEKELDRCASKLGMKGILLYSNLDGHFPDEPKFRSLFSEAEKRGLPVFLHPAMPTTYEATKGFNMAAGLGLMFDTTIALCRLILSGVLEQHPSLKIVCPHVGGALPYLIGRIDHQTMVLRRGAENIKRAPSEYLKQVWLDTVSPLPLAIKFGLEFSGTDKMLYSSDHPWVDPQITIDGVNSLKLPATDLEQIYSTNARRLFHL